MNHRWFRAMAIVIATILSLSGLAYAATDDPPETDDPVVVEESEDEGTEQDEQESEDEGSEESEDETEDETVSEDEGSEEPEAVEPTDAEPADEDDGGEGVERSQEGCEGETYRNHGHFVSSQEERPRSEAAKSDCGKPVHATEDSEDEPEASEEDDEEGE